jgi:hypothetical protein
VNKVLLWACLAISGSGCGGAQGTDVAEPSFQVRLAEGKTTFQRGERISVEMTFDATTPQTFTLDMATYDRSGRLPSEFVVTPKTWVDPLSDYFHGRFGSMIGGMRSVPVLGDGPKTVTLLLNEHVWFTVPGTYTLVVHTSRVRTAEGPLNLESAPLTLTVIEADRAWAASVVDRAVAAMGDELEQTRRQATEDLRFLGTERAAQVMVERFSRGDPKASEFDLEFGIISSPHRERVIELMDAALVAPDLPQIAESASFAPALRRRHSAHRGPTPCSIWGSRDGTPRRNRSPSSC